MSKNKKDIFQQLKSLRSIKPSGEWTSSIRKVLLMEIDGGRGTKNPSLMWGLLLRELFAYIGSASPFVRRVGLVAMTAILVVGGGVFGVRASENSLPGDFLYNVKRTKERVRLNLESSKEAKAHLHIEFAGNRLREIGAVQALSLEDSKKVIKITAAVADYRDEMTEVRNTLNQADDFIKEPFKIIQVAQLVEQKTEQYNDYLNKNIKDGVLSVSFIQASAIKNLDEAIRVGNEISHEAVVVLVNQKDKQGVAEEKKKEIIDTVIKKIEKTQEEVVSLKAAVAVETGVTNKVSGSKIDSGGSTKSIGANGTVVDEKIPITNTDSSEKLGVSNSNTVDVSNATGSVVSSSKMVTLSDSGREKVQAVIDKEPPKADILLNEAQKLVAEGNLSQALEKVQVTQSLMVEIKGRVDEIVNNDSVVVENLIQSAESSQSKTSDNNQPSGVTAPTSGAGTVDAQSVVAPINGSGESSTDVSNPILQSSSSNTTTKVTDLIEKPASGAR